MILAYHHLLNLAMITLVAVSVRDYESNYMLVLIVGNLTI